MLGTLGAIDLARSRPDDARSKLIRSIEALSKPDYVWSGSSSAGSPSAEKYVLLASAYFQLKQYEEARQKLNLAASFPRSPRVSDEFKQVKKELDEIKP
jgi:hypothetical protein